MTLLHPPGISFAPQALAIEAHDIGHLIREASREVERLGKGRSESQETARLTRLLRIALEHCDAICEGASLFKATASSSQAPTPIDLKALADAEIELWRAHAAASTLTLSSTGHGSILGHPRLITRGLRNLIINAIAEAHPESVILISIAQVDCNKAVVSVSNTGRPVSEEIRTRLGTPLESAPLQSGIGLIIVARVAAIHNGTLTTKHQDGVTTFNLTLESPPSW